MSPLKIARISLWVLLTSGIVTSSPLPAQHQTAKPWTYWWWMGSAVTEADITWQMERFARTGLGGVHIIPIYGVKGYEKQAIPFLSPSWMKMLEHTLREGGRLGLGVDMTTGTGWPFGGPNVTPDIAAKKWQPENGQILEQPTGQRVKRAAPGGEGLVLDPFDRAAIPQYVTRFDSAFKTVSLLPRALYNDSYEVYGANWTRDFPAAFKKKRGYRFQDALPLLTDSTDQNAAALARIDYLQTLADLLLDHYAVAWTRWSNGHGMKTRYQAHGSPGNILDLYAAADIPETESFGTSQFAIPGLRIDPDFEEDRFGKPNPLAMKMASSPAHLLGKPLVSSETTTWLANHFKVSLSQVKPQLDELFVSGINHIFFHGTTYTPKDEPFPGWLFYASTNYGPHSHFEPHFQLLNAYIERCQELLQASRPDNDILLYFPIHDLWSEQPREPADVRMLDVHHTERWLASLPFGKLSAALWEKGYTFDYVSDAQLELLTPTPQGGLTTGKASYKTLLIPASEYMPESTLRTLQRLAKQGARIVFETKTPGKVTGWYRHARRQKAFDSNLARLLRNTGNVYVAPDWEQQLAQHAVRPEAIGRLGLTFIRKSLQGNSFYFAANLSDRFERGWVSFNALQTPVERMDPLTGKTRTLPFRNGTSGPESYLELLPGESAFLRAAPPESAPAAPVSHDRSVALSGEWTFEFLEGRPQLTSRTRLSRLNSWTSLPDSAVYFSGTARYSLSFDLPVTSRAGQDLLLDLGDVREVAEVRMNGQPLGTAWSIPFRLTVPSALLKPTDNRLEIDVTNLSANYMRLYDERHPEWKKFDDINIVDITYQPFKASNWQPMPSGLLGPVNLFY